MRIGAKTENYLLEISLQLTENKNELIINSQLIFASII